MSNRPASVERGRFADGPHTIPLEGWRDIAMRTYREFSNDHVLLVSAGATFFILLALFPALTAFVSIYGFVSDPKTIADHVAMLGGLLPSGSIGFLKSQLLRLIEKDDAALSFGFVAGLALAFWSANGGIKTLFKAMNIAYDEKEKRGFIRLNLTAMGFTVGAVVIGILMIVSVGVVPAVLAFAGLGDQTTLIISILRWPILFAACWAGISVIYRFGPSRAHAEWRWIVWGSFISTLLWMGVSALFSWYLENFANYDKTYGSLGAVMGFMMWTWISLTILISGAELNSEIEHQTKRDSTVGPDQPMGQRGAVMADTLGVRYDESDSEDRGADRLATARRAPRADGTKGYRRHAPGAAFLVAIGWLSLSFLRNRRKKPAT